MNERCTAHVAADIVASGMIDTATVAYVTDVDIRSVQRWVAGTSEPQRKAADRLLELKAVLDLAAEVYRPDGISLWLRSPVPALGYDKPADLLRAGEFQRVVGCLLALAEGVTA